MTNTDVGVDAVAAAARPGEHDSGHRGRALLAGLWPGSRRARKRAPLTVALAGTWVGFVVLVAATAQWLPLASPGMTVGNPNAGANWSREFLGTDAVGRSELSRLAFGAQASLGISVVACAVAITVGVLLGLLTAYFGSWLAVVVDILTNAVLAVPPLLLLLAIVLALQPSLLTLTLALSLIFIPSFTRLMQTHARETLSLDYVVAARVMGAGHVRLMAREVLPNSVMPLISYAALVVPSLMVIEGSLSFLGHGVQPPTPSWGAMIAQAQPYLAQVEAPAFEPCIVLFLTVLALNVLGDALRTRMDVRDSQI